MKELLLYMAKSLVEHPEAVSVTQTQNEDGRLEPLGCPGGYGQGDWPAGQDRAEIRTIVKTVAQHNGQRVTVDIVD